MVVEKAADHALVWINRLLAVGDGIAIKRDGRVFIQDTCSSVGSACYFHVALLHS